MSDVLQEPGVVYTHLPARREARPIRDASPGQILWLLCTGLPAVAMLVIHWYVYGLGLLVISGVGYWPWFWGPGYYYPLDWFDGFRIKLHKNTVYSGVESSGRRRRRNRIVIDLRIDDFFSVLGTVYNAKRHTDTIWFKVKGWRHANDDVEDMFAALQRLNDVIKQVIAVVGGDISYQFLNNQRPWDSIPMHEDLDEKFLHEDVVAADPDKEDTVDARGQALIDKVFDVVSVRGADPLACFMLTVKRPHSWRKFDNAAGRGKFTSEHLNRSPMMRVMKAMEYGLNRAGFTGVDIMDYPTLRRSTRRSWDINYAAAKAAGIDVDDKASSVWATEGIKIHPKSKILEMDGSYHRVYMVKGFRKRKVLPGGLYPLFVNNPEWVTISTPSYTVSRSLEEFFLKKIRNVRNALERERYEGGMIEDLEDIEARLEASAQVDRLYLSGSSPVRFGPIIVCSATSIEELLLTEEEMLAKCRLMKISVTGVRGRVRILRAFLSATLGSQI
ncbi:hypothetical protein KDA23_07235 [Candidatus Saccharibacteria bacterium]|nr:hypothetical protein [Candidatus Saccharibacteria bacterium]